MKLYHYCEAMQDRASEDAIYFGSTFEGSPDPDPIEWHLDLGMEWTHISFCPWCGMRLVDEDKDIERI